MMDLGLKSQQGGGGGRGGVGGGEGERTRRPIWKSHDFKQFDRLGGLVVKASTSRAEDPGFESR